MFSSVALSVMTVSAVGAVAGLLGLLTVGVVVVVMRGSVLSNPGHIRNHRRRWSHSGDDAAAARRETTSVWVKLKLARLRSIIGRFVDED